MRTVFAIAILLIVEFASGAEILSRDQIQIWPAFGQSTTAFPESERAAVRLIVSEICEKHGLEKQAIASVLAQYEEPKGRYSIIVGASDFAYSIVVDTSLIHKGARSLTYDRIVKDLFARLRARFNDRITRMGERVRMPPAKP